MEVRVQMRLICWAITAFLQFLWNFSEFSGNFCLFTVVWSLERSCAGHIETYLLAYCLIWFIKNSIAKRDEWEFSLPDFFSCTGVASERNNFIFWWSLSVNFQQVRFFQRSSRENDYTVNNQIRLHRPF